MKFQLFLLIIFEIFILIFVFENLFKLIEDFSSFQLKVSKFNETKIDSLQPTDNNINENRNLIQDLNRIGNATEVLKLFLAFLIYSKSKFLLIGLLNLIILTNLIIYKISRYSLNYNSENNNIDLSKTIKFIIYRIFFILSFVTLFR